MFYLYFRTTRKYATDEDDDLDAMISSLKQKTTGRDMYKYVQEIEGDVSANGHSVGRRSVSPIQRRPLYETQQPVQQPAQIRNPVEGRQQRQSSQSRGGFDPYDHLRGGTGFGFEFEQSRGQVPPSQPMYRQPAMTNMYGYQQQQQVQQTPQMMNPYMAYGARSQPYGYQQQPQMLPYNARRAPQQPPFGYYYE